MGSDADIYAALQRAFDALGVRWYLFGGQAAIVHGATRFTEDIDITVSLDERATSTLVASMKAHQFEMRVDDEKFIERTRVLPLVHEPSNTPVDIVLSGPGIEELFFERVVHIDIDGLQVPVACAEDVVVMKILAGRAKDLDDVVGILTAQAQSSSFDEQRVRELLGLLEQAIDQADLLPSFDACSTRSRRRD